MVTADVIVDLQAGDCGKGKITNALAKDYHGVMRYNGGSNAGHTIYSNDGEKIVTHQVPCGILHDIPSIIGPECVVNVDELINEVEMLKSKGFDDTPYLLWVDYRAHIIRTQHLLLDEKDEKIGTTKKGIGPAYADKMNRTGRRIDDLRPFDYRDHFTIVDTLEVFYYNPEVHFGVENPHLLCEGAQGFQLDINYGNYPFVTSSHCTSGAACLNGLPPRSIKKVIGVMKPYETYVGNNAKYTDEENPWFKAIQEAGNEFGATTGRPRKVNWLNLDKVLPALHVNGVSTIYINKIDVLEIVKKFSVIGNGIIWDFPNVQMFQFYVEEFIRENYDKHIEIIWSRSASTV